jgi:hypothetical protein
MGRSIKLQLTAFSSGKRSAAIASGRALRTCICLVGLPIAGFLFYASTLGAQMHKVEAPQKVTRAVGVYEWTGDLSKPTAARLVPVTLFIDGHFEDAGVYLARPQPFALQTGIVYEVDQAGKPVGTLNLEYAKDIVTRHSATDDNPVGAWYGYGTFVLPKVTPTRQLQPSAKLPVITSTGHDTVSADDDGRPHLTRRAGSESGTSTTPSTASGTTSPGGSTTPTTTPNPAPPADSDRPTLSRRQDSASNAPASPTPTVGADDNDRPTLRHRDPATDNAKPKKHDDGGAVIPLNTSLNDDPNRPVMRRGKPADEVTVAPLTGVPAELHQAVAVSDAVTREEHDFTRPWGSSTERAQVLAAIEALARPRIASYIATNKLALTDPSVQPPAAQVPGRLRSNVRRPPQPAPAPLPLENEQLSGFQLTYGGLPTFVYTAETSLFSGGPVYLTMVAQTLPVGNMQVAFVSVTDAAHLDRTPWFRFVDAVDPDGSHRASLLFELREQSSRQFALYQLIKPAAEQSFVTGIIE